MPHQVSKLVRFFEPMVIDGQDQQKTIGNDFWQEAWDRVGRLATDDRVHSYNLVRFYGEAGREVAPAMPYLYMGRLRPAADHPAGFRPGQGITGPLQPAQMGDEISEPTYLVPFGRRNYLAMLSPTSGATRVAAIERWLNLALELNLTGHQLNLVALIDATMQRKLETSPGATRLQVRVAPGAEVPDNLPGTMMRAVHNAAADAPDDLYVEMTWSAGGHRAGSGSRLDLLQSARAAWSGDWAEKAEVNLQIEDDEGQRTEVHQLVNDRIAIKATIEVPEDAPPSRTSVLTGMCRRPSRSSTARCRERRS